MNISRPAARDPKGLFLRGPHRVWGDAVLQGRREVEGLEGGARLALPLGGEVEGAFVVVAAPHHRAHLARGVFDRHQRRRGAFGARQVALHRLFGGALEAQVEGGADPQAAVVGLLRPVARHHLLAHPVVEVARVDPVHQGLLGGRDLLRGGQRLDRAFFVLRAVQVALRVHLPEHHVAPHPRRLGVEHRVVFGGGLDDPRQQRRLPGLELLHAQRLPRQAAPLVVGLLAEVGLRRRLDPVGPVAEVDRVQVLREDLQLRPVVGQPERQRGLPQLLHERAALLRSGQRVLDELLLDRRGPLHRAPVHDVGDGRPRERAQVDPAVGHEALVLDRDHRLPHDRGDLLLGHQHLVAVAQHPDLGAPVVQQHRVARVDLAVARFQVRQVRGDGHEHAEHERDQAEQRQRQKDREEAELLHARAAAGGQRDGLHRGRESSIVPPCRAPPTRMPRPSGRPEGLPATAAGTELRTPPPPSPRTQSTPSPRARSPRSSLRPAERGGRCA